MTVQSTPPLPSQVTALTAVTSGVPRDQAVDSGRGIVVGRLQRGPLQAHEDEQDREEQRGGSDRGQWREAAVLTVDGAGRHDRMLPKPRVFMPHWPPIASGNCPADPPKMTSSLFIECSLG
jgi:hypothetical protein